MKPSRSATMILLVCLVTSCPSAPAQDVDAAKTDRTVLVIIAPYGPVFAEMNISVDGQAYRLWVTKFLSKRVDLNGDDQLTVEELKLIPERLLLQTAAGDASRALRGATGDPTAESVSTEVFSNWFAAQLSRSFDLIAGAVQASEAVRLAALIDANGDGKVSREEVVIGHSTMRFRDLDDDQTFSAAELMPYRDPRNQAAAIVPDVANLPFVQLGDEESIHRTAQQFLTRYGSPVPLTVLRHGSSAVARFDTDQDSALGLEELKSMLQDAPIHLKINVQLADRANASDIQFEIPEFSRGFCSVQPTRRGRVKLLIDDMPIDIRSRGGSKDSRGFLINFVLQRLSAYDEDKTGYLSEDEYPQMQQQMMQIQVTAEFKDVDLNQDGMVFREEIKTYIERDAIATQSRIEVSIKQDGKTLFKILDKNTDRRLTVRELQEGYDSLLEFDLNDDQQLTESELGTAYMLQIGLGQAESLRMDSRQGMGMAARSADAILPGVSGLDGPEWFRRMDRNQDRDVSYREFLGPRQMFVELDTDDDGLLSATEAEKLSANTP